MFSRTSGPLGEVRGDLVGALEVEAVVVVHPVGVLEILPEADAEQDVVRRVVVGAQEVRVVRRDDGEAEVAGEARRSAG